MVLIGSIRRVLEHKYIETSLREITSGAVNFINLCNDDTQGSYRVRAFRFKFRRAVKWPIEWSKEFDLAFADVTDLFYRQS